MIHLEDFLLIFKALVEIAEKNLEASLDLAEVLEENNKKEEAHSHHFSKILEKGEIKIKMMIFNQNYDFFTINLI